MEEQKKGRKNPVPQLIQGATTLSLVIPEEVEAKIRHLCSRVHDVEWSGTLFYRTEGSFDDGTFKATCLDICVMDIGSTGFTQYDDTADIIAYRINHPELLQEGVYEGLIHSHNNMSAFFSGTDSNTLLQEGTDLNHFLSLVVCNNGPYVARVTRKLVKKVEAKAHIVYTESSYYHTYEDVLVEVAKDKVTEKDQEESKEAVLVEWFNLDINKATVEEPFSEIDQRLKDIRANKRKVEAPKQGLRPSPLIPAPGIWNRSQIPSNPSIAMSVEGRTPDKNYEKVEPKQGELFPNQGLDSLDNVTPSVPLALMESVDEKVTKSLCTQLLLGSIFVDVDSVNLEKWVAKMDSLYIKRFGDLNDADNCTNLENWLELFVGQLIEQPNDEEMESRVILTYGEEEYDRTDFTVLYAYEMAKFLYELPDSIVKDMMIDELKTYLPYELEEYL